jgi:hypothetical protein
VQANVDRNLDPSEWRLDALAGKMVQYCYLLQGLTGGFQRRRLQKRVDERGKVEELPALRFPPAFLSLSAQFRSPLLPISPFSLHLPGTTNSQAPTLPRLPNPAALTACGP